MDLSLTWRGDYVIRAALELSRRHASGEWEKAEAIARATGVPEGYVRQILRLLVQQGIAEARAGNTGGYRLCRNPEEVTVLDVVECGEGPLLTTRCVLRGTGCNPKRPCLLHPVLARAHTALRRELQAATLASLLQEGATPASAGAERQ